MKEIVQKFKLEKGENWISINVIPNDMSIYNIFNYDMLSDGDMIKSKTKKAVFKKGKFMGSLKKIEGNNMYIIIVKNKQELEIKGIKIPKSNIIKLEKGENWFCYNSEEKKQIKSLLKYISDNDYVMYKEHKTKFKNGEWVDSTLLQYFEPNKGYIIYLQNPIEYSLEKYIKPKVITEYYKTETKDKNNTIYYIIFGIIMLIIIYLFFKKLIFIRK